jgi:putative ATP-dependent endonuclease of the OLD family
VRILRCSIRNFRGFDEVEVVPRGHVLLVGEPRSGRSDLLAALGKVFEVDLTRLDERDFYRCDLDGDIEIEVTLGDLGSDLQQRFLDELEFWDVAEERLVAGTDDLGELPGDASPAVRLAYRGRWDDVDERGDQTIYWPKRSDPSIDSFRRVRREDRQALPFHRLPGGRPLNLAPRGLLRSALTQTEAEALGEALQEMRAGIDRLSGELVLAVPVIAALDATIAVLRPYIGSDAPAAEVVRFLPDEGSLSGLLRALAPALDLGDEAGYLPLARHGSTTQSQVGMAEAIATASHNQAVVTVDDFGDSLDTSSAQRLAALLRRQSSQVWLSTRRPETARSFDSSELVRLTRQRPSESPSRRVHYGAVPTTRAQRVASRELHRQILPAMTARGLIVVEGSHDIAAYGAIAERGDTGDGTLPPEAYGIRVIDGGAQGGIDQVARLAEMSRSLGFRVVALVDYDRDETTAASRLAELQGASDAVIRLPKGKAIEAAILDGIPDGEIVAALSDLSTTYRLPLVAGWETLSGDALVDQVINVLKSNNGLHAQFIYALPTTLPVLACEAFQMALDCCRGMNTNAFVQM